MKLVEILARELKEWPVDESLPLRQANDDSLYVSAQHTNGKDTNYLDIFVSKSENRLCDVTRAQWEAERNHIAAMDVISASEHANAEPESGQRTQYEQELWDKVAIESFKTIVTSDYLKAEFYSEVAAEAADAFMAERAKRMKK